jgi:hypothetical protein
VELVFVFYGPPIFSHRWSESLSLDHIEGGPDPIRYRKFKWISLAKLAECYRVHKQDTIVGVEWFTTLVTPDT